MDQSGIPAPREPGEPQQVADIERPAAREFHRFDRSGGELRGKQSRSGTTAVEAQDAGSRPETTSR